MNTIADQGTIEEEALIQYIIDGVVTDDESTKSILYSANTITELRKNMERYDKIKEKSDKKMLKGQKKAKAKQVDKSDKETKQKSDKDSRCFGCGSPEHVARDCPDKENGPKCFKCNAFGHIAAKCNTSDKSIVKKDGEINAVDLVEQIATDDEIIVELNGMQIRVMIDIGTRQTLLRQSEYEKLSNQC